MDLNLTVRRTDSAATENADRLRLIFTVPTFHGVLVLGPTVAFGHTQGVSPMTSNGRMHGGEYLTVRNTCQARRRG